MKPHKILKYVCTIIVLFINFNKIYAQDSVKCHEKIIKSIGNLIDTCILIDSVEEYFVDEYSKNILYTTQWANKGIDPDTIFSSNDTILVERVFVSVNKISDSLYIYINLRQINIVNYNILPIFPKTISSLHKLSGIYNNGLVSDKTFAKVPPLDHLTGIGIGTVTDSLTEVPKILSSKLLSEVEILYNAQGDKIILKMLKKLLGKKSIKEVTIIAVHNAAFSSSMVDELSKLKLEYEQRNKKLVFYL